MHIEVNGTRLWFDVEGPALVPEGPALRERPTVVALHGGPASFDHSYLRPGLSRLSQTAQVVYLDLRDHGRSGRGDPNDWSLEACADDVKAFCDALGIRRPIVFGHSLGGFVALHYAIRHPGHAGALLLQATAARWDVPRFVENFRRLGGDEVADIAKRLYGTADQSVSMEETVRLLSHFGPNVPGPDVFARTIMNADLMVAGRRRLLEYDVLGALSAASVPALVSVGDLDPITPLAAARELALALPCAYLHVLPGLGHFPWLDEPAHYWPHVEDFIARAGDSRADQRR
jgi:pimeloyl-ACP methyl ester carboxylesterase